jgi:hypothetical protein
MDVAMKILYEKKLQHQIYESHQDSLYYGSKKFEKKMPPISPYKYEALDFSILRPYKHTYTIYIV